MKTVKAHDLVEFTYTKADKSTSERKVFVISPPSDMLFGVDLTEYSKEELDQFNNFLLELLTRKHNEIRAEIDSLDLSSNYRQFKKSGIVY